MDSSHMFVCFFCTPVTEKQFLQLLQPLLHAKAWKGWDILANNIGDDDITICRDFATLSINDVVININTRIAGDYRQIVEELKTSLGSMANWDWITS